MGRQINMKEPNFTRYKNIRAEIVFSIKNHMNFLRGKLDLLESQIDSGEGCCFALTTEQLIGASQSIPLIVRDLGRIRTEYEFYINQP